MVMTITRTVMKTKFLRELTLLCQMIVAAKSIAKLPFQQFQEHDSQQNKQSEQI